MGTADEQQETQNLSIIYCGDESASGIAVLCRRPAWMWLAIRV